MLLSDLEHKEIAKSEPTTLYRVAENVQNNSRLGLTTLMVLSMATNAVSGTLSASEKDINFGGIGRYSYTNLEISNIVNTNYNAEIYQNILSEDYLILLLNQYILPNLKLKLSPLKSKNSYHHPFKIN